MKEYPSRGPKFGPLQNLNVVFSAVETAGPFGPSMMSMWGANVIGIENPDGGDTIRAQTPAEQERKNVRSLAVNIFTPHGRKILERLLKKTDIYVISSKGPAFDKKGLSDEELWKINPKLVIVHVTGFGMTGDPATISRACYDGVAQAFGGYISQNGFPGGKSLPIYPYLCDYLSATLSALGALAAYIRAQETGIGDSVDMAMYESTLPYLTCDFTNFLNNNGELFDKPGNKDINLVPFGIYECKNGREIMIDALGLRGVSGVLKVVGIYDEIIGTEDYPEGTFAILTSSPKAKYVDQKVAEWCAGKTVDEAESALIEANVACSRVMTFPELVSHPNFIARNSLVEWETICDNQWMPAGSTFRGQDQVPKFKKHPTQVWRGMPTVGMDNDVILGEELGFTKDEISEFYQSKAISHGTI